MKWLSRRGSSRRPVIQVPPLSDVEVLMRSEEALGLSIPDDEAERILSVGEFKHYLVLQTGAEHGSCRDSQRAFRHLRDVTCDVLGVARSRVRPSSSWRELLPGRLPGLVWRRIVRRSGMSELPTPGLLSPGRWRLPRFRRRVGDSARLLAALHHVPPAPGQTWTRQDIEFSVDRWIVECCEISDFSDEVLIRG